MREIKTENHPANQTSCYVHFQRADGTHGFTEYYPTTKLATAEARRLVYHGEAVSAAVIKPQITYRAA